MDEADILDQVYESVLSGGRLEEVEGLDPTLSRHLEGELQPIVTESLDSWLLLM